MDPIYLLALCRKIGDKGSKLSRIARCSFAYDSRTDDGYKIGEWWRLSIADNPLPSMLDLVFVDSEADPGVRAANALEYRLVTGLSMASKVKWECDCGPIDADYAVSVRIELEVLSGEIE